MKAENDSITVGRFQLKISRNLVSPLFYGSIVLILISLSFLYKFFVLGCILFALGVVTFLLWLGFFIYWQIKDPSKLRSGEFEIESKKIK